MKISKRLEAVASLVSENRIIVDIGTDHGYVPIYLIQENIVSKAYAADINEGPLSRADNNIKEAGLDDAIKTYLSDGFVSVPKNDIDGAVIAGMGGDLIVHIIDACEYVGELKELVISPHKHADLVREKIASIGFVIVDEKMVEDEGKFYPIIKAWNCQYVSLDDGDNVDGLEQGNCAIGYRCNDEVELAFGPVLLRRKDEVLKKFLTTEYTKFMNFKKNVKGEEPVLEQKIALLKKGIDRYE